jgi:WD40 repeat protein
MLATCSGDKTVRLWAMTSHSDSSQWECIHVLEGRELATASFDSTTGVWEYDERDKEWECVATLEGHENETKSVAWSSNGSLLATCSRDKSVWIWEGNYAVFTTYSSN